MRKILNIGTFGLAGMLLGKKKAKDTPAPEATPAVMPTPDDDAVLRARKRSIVQRMGRNGRESTILTGDRLGS